MGHLQLMITTLYTLLVQTCHMARCHSRYACGACMHAYEYCAVLLRCAYCSHVFCNDSGVHHPDFTAEPPCSFLINMLSPPGWAGLLQCESKDR